MSTTKLRVSQKFASGSAEDLVTLARTVSAKLYSDVDYISPPFPKDTLDVEIAGLEEAMELQASSGPAGTALKNERQAYLVSLLQELALYVQVASKNNLSMLLDSGFQAMSRNRSMVPLATPLLQRIKQGMSGETEVTVKPVATAKCYQVDIAPVSNEGVLGEFSQVAIQSSSRNILVTGLTPGNVYAYRIRAIGGSTGFSDWSNITTHRSL
ncbi:fibronectin type III domain-containing protein [Luteolibacter pohnpeiensis]|uniref:Fibronectin type III domain-containing protein n=1 Tax=Luteolibacter pohnpeiensis TaxID=454153 RepID=A0A934VRL9_9BACT|nr:fibronectin type III domain-containing protein [Luteolibacter pohnpeiensis]MBK1883356.1 fibronectin type III domain-containing protein [Luteolibacter pohnpeiensis]